MPLSKGWTNVLCHDLYIFLSHNHCVFNCEFQNKYLFYDKLVSGTALLENKAMHSVGGGVLLQVLVR